MMRRASKLISLLLMAVMVLTLLPAAAFAAPPQSDPTHRHNWVVVSEKKATCTQAGTKTWRCTLCGKTYTETTRSALGHSNVKVEGKAPTCTEPGLTDGYKCSRCGAITKWQQAIPALGHDWDEGAVTTEPSGFTPGVRTFTCQHDPSHTRTEEIDPSPWLFATFTGSFPDFTTFDLATKDLTPLTITEQPKGGSITRYEDETVHLTCAATGGTGDYTYEWYSKKSVNLWGWDWPGYYGKQTEPGFDAETGDRTYWCVVTDSAGDTVATDKVDITYKIRIADQPDNANLQPAGKATLSCEAADGSGYYSYRWVDNQDHEIDVGSSIDVTEVGDYMCIATDDVTGEEVHSSACQVYDVEPFTLVYLTGDCEYSPDNSGILVSEFKGGVMPYEIWWDKDGEECESYPAEVNENYGSVIHDATVGTYTVHATDAMGAVITATCHYTAPKLHIAEQPVGGTIPKDWWAPISVTVADGEAPYHFVLYRNGQQYQEVTKDPSFVAISVFYPGEYYFHIEDSQGREADSDVVTFEDAVFRIKKQSNAGVLYTATDTFTLSVEVEGGKEPYSYEWMQYKGDTPWYTKASSTATCVAEQPGKYACRITDATGETIRTKDIHVLYNGQKPRILKQPSGLTLTPDEKGHFSFSLSCEAASGNGDESCLEYRWERHSPDGYWSYAGSEKTMTHSLLGSYRCKVIDVISKEYTYTQTVTVAEAVTASADVNMIRYGGRVGDMEANLTIKGGSAPYTIKVYEVIDVWSEDGRIIDERTVLYKTYADKTAEEVQGFYFTFPPNQQIFIKENGEWKSYMDYIKVYAIITDADGRSTRVNLTGYSG